jgi:hypothetical protein
MGTIRTTYEIITPESAEHGDVHERGWKDEEGSPYTVEEAIELLQGLTPSSTFFHLNIWYTEYGEPDMVSGDTENISYHLVKGTWTEAEEQVIFGVVVFHHTLPEKMSAPDDEATWCARCGNDISGCKCVGSGGESGPFHK